METYWPSVPARRSTSKRSDVGFVFGDPVERNTDAIAGSLEGVLFYDISEY